jgi:hypothetical protein
MKTLRIACFSLAITALTGIALCGVLGLVFDEPGMLYSVTAEFQELPESDDSLRQWLRNQPGVVHSYWSTPQITRSGKSVTVKWHHWKTWPRDPVSPNLREQFRNFGYRGLFKYEERKRKETKEWS